MRCSNRNSPNCSQQRPKYKVDNVVLCQACTSYLRRRHKIRRLPSAPKMNFAAMRRFRDRVSSGEFFGLPYSEPASGNAYPGNKRKPEKATSFGATLTHLLFGITRKVFRHQQRG